MHVLKTLFVYCSEDDTVNALCKESVRKAKNTVALEIGVFSKKSFFSRFGSSKSQKFTASANYDIDFDAFDKIIFACDEFFGEIPSELSAFIKKHEMRYKDIDCIVFGDGRNVRKATDVLRVQVALSGGTVRSAVGVSVKELKRGDEDVLFSVRHRFAV